MISIIEPGGDRHQDGYFTMTPERKTALAKLALAACFAVSLFFLVYPVYVIRPFRHQGAGELAIALTVLRYRPVVMGLCVTVAIGALVGRWRRVGMIAGAAGVCLFAALSRINIYEKMFHPVDRPEFQAVGETKLDGREMVTAVEIGPAARAYPVRITSYHHIVNDIVNGVPIVATY